MGRKIINAPMEELCRCKPCGRFGPRDSCAPPGLDHRLDFLGVLVATLPPPQATRLARSAGRIMRLNRSVLRIHKTSKISNKEFFSSPKNVYPTLRVSRIGGKCNALQQRDITFSTARHELANRISSDSQTRPEPAFFSSPRNVCPTFGRPATESGPERKIAGGCGGNDLFNCTSNAPPPVGG